MKYDCLVIDDEKELADNTCEYLNMFDVKTYACYSKYECEEFLKNNDTSVILLDINLQNDSGFELCKQLRKDKDIPILFISARNTDEKYGDKIITTMDFEELIKSQMDTFISVANLMVILISIISGLIIILVLYLLMKSMIYNRRYEYGILKALGYKTKDLIIQNVLAFVPNIIFATIIGMIFSYYTTNPYIGFMMRSFGIMKCTMSIPLDLIIISAVFLIGISFVSTILMSLKIKKIEPYSLLIGE